MNLLLNHTSLRAGLALATAVSFGCALRADAPLHTADPNCRGAIVVDTPADSAEPMPAHWIVASEPEEESEIGRWCAGVGAPVMVAGVPAAVPADSLLVVTWNVYLGGGDLIAFVSDLRAGRFTDGAPVEHFALLLQEAYRADDLPDVSPHAVRFAPHHAPAPPSGTRIDVVEAARELGLHLVFLPTMRNGRPGVDPEEERGNAILSTAAMESPTFIELPLERHRRVSVVATVRGVASDGDEWSLRLANVHLDNRSTPERFVEWFGAARLRQARALTTALEHESAIIVAGDLNSWSFDRFERAPAHLREHFPDAPDDGTRTLTMLGVVGRRLDHLMARLPEGRASTPVTVEERYGSDHHPVMAWVTVNDPTIAVDTDAQVTRSAGSSLR